MSDVKELEGIEDQLSLDERRENAEGFLHPIWSHINTFSERLVRCTNSVEEEKDKLLVNVWSEADHALFNKLFEKSSEKYESFFQKFLKSQWTYAQVMSRYYFGDDATDAALDSLKSAIH